MSERKQALAAIQSLIDKARIDRQFHKDRGPSGNIEAAAASIRIHALIDAFEAVRLRP